MVHITPNVHDGEIRLCLNTRLPLWRHRTFRIALGISLVLHLVALTLFRVPNVVSNPNERAVKPIAVTADANSGVQTVVLVHQNADRRMRFLAPPRSGLPPLPALIEGMDAELSGEGMIGPEFDAASPRYHPEQHLEWLLSGPVANERIISVLPTWLDEAPALDQRVRFTIQIDQRLGQVLWLYPVETSADKPLTAQLEQLARRLRFQTHANGGVIQGELEVLIYGGEAS